MGQKLPPCAQLGATRSRQDESKEVGEVGSKRTSSRCNAVHHVCWGRLISRLLLISIFCSLHAAVSEDAISLRRRPAQRHLVSTARNQTR
jgi:hypothetical protein